MHFISLQLYWRLPGTVQWYCTKYTQRCTSMSVCNVVTGQLFHISWRCRLELVALNKFLNNSTGLRKEQWKAYFASSDLETRCMLLDHACHLDSFFQCDRWHNHACAYTNQFFWVLFFFCCAPCELIVGVCVVMSTFSCLTFLYDESLLTQRIVVQTTDVKTSLPTHSFKG